VPVVGKRVLVTGGGGFIGACPVKRLVHDSWDVAVVDNMRRTRRVEHPASPPARSLIALRPHRASVQDHCDHELGLGR
jgi:nucleoside-diphosphate-sugar epimerase